MKYLTNSGLSYFLNKIKAYLTSSTYLNSIGISNSEIDDIADDAGYSSGSLPASEDVFLTGDIIPNTDNSVDLGASSKNIKMVYTKGITINGTQFLPSDYIPKTGSNQISGDLIPSTDNVYDLGSTSYNFRNINTKLLSSSDDLNLYSSFNGNTAGSFLTLKKIDSTSESGSFQLNAHTETQIAQLIGYPDGTLIWSGNVFTNGINTYSIGSRDTSNSSVLYLLGGNSYPNGAQINLYGNNHQSNGTFEIVAHGNTHYFRGDASGTLTWSGQPIQYVSDQRLKQQITEIDDKLLDAWEDVNLVQFKYNDAVEQKGKDNARLHTGYVVQQINEACQKHNIDISEYGLFCHEEYPEETEEVEVTQEDGTIKKETKVVREASEHYSLRYTEVYAVECAYLRKQIKELKERLEKLERK